MEGIQMNDTTLALDTLLKADLDRNRVKVIVTSVSRSGMSRRMKIYAPHQNTDGTLDILDLTWATAQVLGLSMNTDGVKMQGAGMDFTFKLRYDLGITLFNNGYAIHD